MNLNCKQGDLAIVVRSHAHNEGKIVRCVRFVGNVPTTSRYSDHWEIDRQLMGEFRPARTVSDSCLRPLRDSDGEDEVLRLVGRPVGDKTTYTEGLA